MKKMLLALTLASMLAVPALAVAGDKEDGYGQKNGAEEVYQGGGYSGPKAAQMTVAEALKLGDDAWVVLTGKIDKQIEHKRYQFSDSSGTVTVKISDKVWRGLTVGPDEVVELQGKVDKEFKGLEIDVKQITKK